MDNPKPCQHCGTANAPESLFCSHCGQRFSGASVNPDSDSVSSHELDARLQEKIEQLNQLAAILEDKIELNCRNKIETWLRAGGILGVILGGTGIFFLTDKIQETTALADKANQEISAMVEATRKELELFKNNTSALEKELQKKIETIDRQAAKANESSADAQRASEEVRSLKDKTTSDVTDIRKKLEAQENRLTKQGDKIRQTENATFNIFVELRGDASSEGFKRIREKLHEKGFRINESEVNDNAAVDRNEIIYFSKVGEPKAKEIADIIQHDVEDIHITEKNYPDRNESDLKLKLKI